RPRRVIAGSRATAGPAPWPRPSPARGSSRSPTARGTSTSAWPRPRRSRGRGPTGSSAPCQDRSTTTPSGQGATFVKLRQTGAARPVLGRLRIQVPRSGDRPAREATVTVRSASVELKPPYRPDRELPVVTVNAVLIREESAPAGAEPIEWLLLTGL